ncbi:MAG: hypothetical protein OHK0022_21050 [Roseiflexaceae bacterium]
MSLINELHEQAMEQADLAFIARRRGDIAKAQELTHLAFELEAKAASLVEHDLSAEPTRSILYRSAAVLAIESGATREAERLIATALSGNPPIEIAEELRDLLEQVNFNRHLSLRDINLDPNEIQFSIAGNEAGHGIALTHIFIERIKDMERIILRTVERLLGIEYRDRGSSKSSVTQGYQLYITAPRPGSFAVTLRLGRQMSLPGFDISDAVINEVLDCFELINNGKEEELREKIPQQAYYQNFLGLVKRVAPDGDSINFVGLTTIKDGRTIGVPLTRQQKSISITPVNTSEGSEVKSIQIIGQLKYASSIKSNQIKVIDASGKSHSVIVPEGLMGDIVKPLWDSSVVVTAVREDRQLRLIDINPITE